MEQVSEQGKYIDEDEIKLEVSHGKQLKHGFSRSALTEPYK
jgi:hypothetical protein